MEETMSVFDFPVNDTIIRKGALKIIHKLTWSGWSVQKWDMLSRTCPKYLVIQGVKKDRRHIYILPYAVKSPSMTNDVPEIGFRKTECLDFQLFKRLLEKKQPGWKPELYVIVYVSTNKSLFAMDIDKVMETGRPYVSNLIHEGGTQFVRLDSMTNVTGEFAGVWLNVDV